MKRPHRRVKAESAARPPVTGPLWAARASSPLVFWLLVGAVILVGLLPLMPRNPAGSTPGFGLLGLLTAGPPFLVLRRSEHIGLGPAILIGLVSAYAVVWSVSGIFRHVSNGAGTGMAEVACVPTSLGGIGTAFGAIYWVVLRHRHLEGFGTPMSARA